MQITINTDTDDLPAVIRVLQALTGESPTGRLHKLMDKVAEPTLQAEPDLTRTYTGCFNVEDYTQGSDIQGPATVLRAGKQIATFPEGLYRDVFFDEPDHKIEIPGTPADQIYTGAALRAAVPPPCSAHATEGPDYEDGPEFAGYEQRAGLGPKPVFVTVKNCVGRAGGSGGNGQPPKSLFDAPLPPCDQTEKVGEATGVPCTALSDVTVDAAGLPWDERIHSSAKSKLANGNWKLRRGVDPALVASVEAELRGDPKPPVAPPPPATATATETPAPAAPSAPPTPPAPKPITNAAELVAAVMDKRFTTDQVNAACQAVGVENVASLLAKQDKLPEVLKELGI